MTLTDRDRALMTRALELATQGLGTTAPNPMVGALVVKGDQIVGTGYHHQAGGPHAEVEALRGAGDLAEGATLYVSLEPCCHHGRTPPCTDAILNAGIRVVHVGATDPNPEVRGHGIARLREAGLSVHVHATSDDDPLVRLNEVFNHYITEGTPFVTVKLATTMDGRIAARGGASQWITGAPARARGHALRAQSSAILVGSGTALADDPELTARDVEGPPRHPRRVLLDSRLRVPVGAKMLRPEGGPIVATACALDSAEAQARVASGVEVWSLPDTDGRVDLPRLMARLAEAELSSVLVEGGGQVAASLFRLGLVQKIHAFIAPRLMGGDGLAAIASLGVTHPDQAPRLRFDTVTRIGHDVEVVAYPTDIVRP